VQRGWRSCSQWPRRLLALLRTSRAVGEGLSAPCQINDLRLLLLRLRLSPALGALEEIKVHEIQLDVRDFRGKFLYGSRWQPAGTRNVITASVCAECLRETAVAVSRETQSSSSWNPKGSRERSGGAHWHPGLNHSFQALTSTCLPAQAAEYLPQTGGLSF